MGPWLAPSRWAELPNPIPPKRIVGSEKGQHTRCERNLLGALCMQQRRRPARRSPALRAPACRATACGPRRAARGRGMTADAAGTPLRAGSAGYASSGRARPPMARTGAAETARKAGVGGRGLLATRMGVGADNAPPRLSCVADGPPAISKTVKKRCDCEDAQRCCVHCFPQS